MFRSVIFAAVMVLAVSSAAFTQDAQFGTAAEAKAMLERTVAAIKVDRTKTIAAINKGEDGFRDRDLYPGCTSLDGVFVAHTTATMIGKNRNDFKDKTGKPFGAEIMKVAEEGKIAELTYMWPRPGADATPVQKVSFITQVGDLVCLVGYYK